MTNEPYCEESPELWQEIMDWLIGFQKNEPSLYSKIPTICITKHLNIGNVEWQTGWHLKWLQRFFERLCHLRDFKKWPGSNRGEKQERLFARGQNEREGK